jgi:ABC-type transporter Mla subunit MlaD
MSSPTPLSMSARRQITRLEKQLEQCAANIARERDRMRELLSDYESLAQNCDDATSLIQEAVDKLSELV